MSDLDVEVKPQREFIEEALALDEIDVQMNRNLFRDPVSMFADISSREAYALKDTIYNWYLGAINRRGRSGIAQRSFEEHFFEDGNREKSMFFGGKKDGYLLGSEINEVFVPTHFAPSSLRGGYRLIKELVSTDTPVALFITDDLVQTISKMEGWKVLPFSLRSTFDGEVVEKRMVLNNWEAATRLITHEVGKKVVQTIETAKEKFTQFADKARNLFKKESANADDLDQELADAFKEELS